MTRFAGGVPGSMLNTSFPQRPNVEFQGIQFSGKGGENISLAGNAAAPVGQIFNSLTSPAFDKIAANAVANAAAEDAAKMKAESDVQSSGLIALGGVQAQMHIADGYAESAQIQGDAYEEAAKIQADASKSAANKEKEGDIWTAFGSVAAVGLPLLAGCLLKYLVQIQLKQ